MLIRKKKRRSVAEATRRQRESETKPAKLSDYIYHLPEILEITDKFPIVLIGRASSRQQDNDGSLKRQAARLRKAVKDLGGRLLLSPEIVVLEVSPGKPDRPGFDCVIALASSNGAIIVAETADRFLRSQKFNPKTNPDAVPTRADIEEFMRRVNGIPLATIIHPDTDYKEIKRYQSKVETGNPKIKNHRVGWRAERREKYLHQVLRLRAEGVGYKAIAKQLNLTKSLVQFWCAKVDP